MSEVKYPAYRQYEEIRVDVNSAMLALHCDTAGDPVLRTVNPSAYTYAGSNPVPAHAHLPPSRPCDRMIPRNAKIVRFAQMEIR
jgi:hypothetical protein